VYDTTAIHRVVKGFVAQGGYLPSRRDVMEARQQSFVRQVPGEFNPTPHERGIVSMARGDDPNSATSSFFIVLGRVPALDNRYTVFGRLVEGLDVLDKIEAAPVDGETPIDRIDVIRVRVTQ
jgi:peptidyl-prolyl cis-trans isomerase B (cyclophilin B)